MPDALDEVAGDGGQRVRAEAVIVARVPIIEEVKLFIGLFVVRLKDCEVREIVELVFIHPILLLEQPLFQRLDLLGRKLPLLGVLLDGGVSDVLGHELKSGVIHDISCVHSVLLCAPFMRRSVCVMVI